MDLERLRIELKERGFKGYLFDKPVDQIIADVRKRAEADRRRYRLGTYAGLVLLFVVVAAAVIIFYEVHAVAGRIALLVIMPAVFYELLFMLKWWAEEYDERFDLPDRIFLVQERARILRRIRWTKWQIAWYAVMGIAWFIYLFILPKTPELGDTLYFICGFLLGLVCLHVFALFDRLMGLRPELITVEHDLKNCDTVSEDLEGAERE